MDTVPAEPSYTIVAQISRESTTEILHAVEVHTRVPYVVKLPLPNCDQTITEAAVLKTISHAAIIPLIDVVATEHGPALILPYAHGGDLFTRVAANRALSESATQRIVFRMLAALAYLHGRRIVHRDIKLENIFLMSEDGSDAVLGDFGYAIEIPEGGHAEQRCGSPLYAAPEIWERRPYSEKVDIWSLGVTMFVMLVGEFPYPMERGTVAMECIKREVHEIGKKPALAGVSIEGRRLLARMLTINPTDRVGAEEALNDPWFARSADDGGFLPTPKYLSG
jgi:serine/threonine protein kinase